MASTTLHADAGHRPAPGSAWPGSGRSPPTTEREPRDHGHFDLLAARYRYLRTFTPAVIAALPLTGNTASPDVAALMAAVDVLRELNTTGRTTVPQQARTPAATSFVPARWRSYLDTTRGQGRGAAHRRYWELSVLFGVRARLVSATWGFRDSAATPTRPRCSSPPKPGPRSATTSAPSPAPAPTRRGSCTGSKVS